MATESFLLIIAIGSMVPIVFKLKKTDKILANKENIFDTLTTRILSNTLKLAQMPSIISFAGIRCNILYKLLRVKESDTDELCCFF